MLKGENNEIYDYFLIINGENKIYDFFIINNKKKICDYLFDHKR